MVYYNPYILREYNPLYDPTNQFFVRGSHGKQEPSCDLMISASPEKKNGGVWSEVKNLRFRFCLGTFSGVHLLDIETSSVTRRSYVSKILPWCTWSPHVVDSSICSLILLPHILVRKGCQRCHSDRIVQMQKNSIKNTSFSYSVFLLVPLAICHSMVPRDTKIAVSSSLCRTVMTAIENLPYLVFSWCFFQPGDFFWDFELMSPSSYQGNHVRMM